MARRSACRSSASVDATSTVAMSEPFRAVLLKATIATRSPERKALIKAFAASRTKPSSSRVDPEVSSSKAISNGVSVVAKLVIRCGLPSSSRVKFSGRKSERGWPVRSVTTAGTETSWVSTRTTSPSATSSVGIGVGVGVGCGVLVCPPTLRGRC